MGMGLSISQAIVRAHGGRIDFHNNDTRGATFWFTLPSRKRKSPTMSSNQTVFVVDDDEGVREGLSLLLSTIGQPCELYESAHLISWTSMKMAEVVAWSWIFGCRV